MRKTAAALITLGLAALALSGCAGSTPSFDGASCAPTSDVMAQAVTVSGKAGTEPTVKVETPVHVPSVSVSENVKGGGTAVTEADQPVAIDVALYSGQTGKQLVSTYSGQTPPASNVKSWDTQVPAIGAALKCATAGSRLIVGFPAKDLGEQLAQQFGVAADDSVVGIIDLAKVYLPHAEGALVYNDALGLPTVVRAPDGRPGIIVPDATVPTKLVVQTLIKGDGEKVTGDTPIQVQYTGVTWADRKVFDSSWDRNPAKFDLNRVIPGFAEGLKGQTIGSQVMIVIPPDLGYGAQAQASIPANSTLVFVVDILGVDDSPASGQ